MPLLSKAGSILKQTANKQIKSELSSFKLSIYHAIRCTSTVGNQEALRGSSYPTDQQSPRKAFARSGEVDGKTLDLHAATDGARNNFGGFYGSRYGFGVGYGLRSYNNVASYISSAANEHDDIIKPNTLRPLSPHLPVYKPQINSTRSILNRISASYLTAITLGYYLVFMKMGSICFTFDYFYKFLFYSSGLFPISLELSALAMAYHAYYGITHLFADFKGIKFLRFTK